MIRPSDRTFAWQNLTLYGLAAILFIYIIIRAYLIPFTWDESYSWLNYVRSENWFPTQFDLMSANNHLLNTWGMRCSEFFFGNSPLALRIPNLLISMLYLWACIQFAKRQASLLPALAVFFALALHTYLLDFFGLARGYGMFYSFLLWALLLLYKWCITSRIYYAISGIILLAIACFANLTALTVLLPATATALLFLFTNWEKQSSVLSLIGKILLIALPVIITLYILVPYSMELNKVDALFFGERKNWFTGTFGSLGAKLMYRTDCPVWVTYLFAAILSACILFCGIVLITKIIRRSDFLYKGENKFTLLLFLIVIGAVAIPIVQHQIYDTPYLSERTALFYFPLIVLLVIQFLRMTTIGKNILIGSLTFFLMLLLIHALFTFNFYHALEWSDEGDVEALTEEMNASVKNDYELVFEIGTQFLSDPKYLQTTGKLSHNISIIHSDIVKKVADYCYHHKNDVIDYTEYEVQKEFPKSKTVLLRRKQPLKLTSAVELEKTDFETAAGISFTNSHSGKKVLLADSAHLYPYSLKWSVPDSLTGKFLRFELEGFGYQDQHVPKNFLVLSVDRDSSSILYATQSLADFIPVCGKWSPFRIVLPMQKDYRTNDKVVLYIYSTGTKPTYFDDFKVRLLVYEK